jgi:ArsR family transcriptional regulator, arsenate/arsenite/antimonite-responsive transcriptional repressor
LTDLDIRSIVRSTKIDGGHVAARVVQDAELAPVECCTPVATPGVTTDQAATLAAIFKALADPHRVRIVNLLANAAGPVCVCEFMPQLGLSQGTVSFHLRKLLDVGLLEREQRGTWAYYSLNREGLDRLADVFITEEGAR